VTGAYYFIYKVKNKMKILGEKLLIESFMKNQINGKTLEQGIQQL